MQAIGGAALMLLQDDPAQLTHDVHLLMIFMGILAISVLAVVVVVMIAGIVIAGLAGRAIKSAEALEKRASPILDKANELIIEFSPKLRTISDNAEHISTVVRGKMDEVSVTVTKVNQTVQQVNETVQEVNETVRDANGRARSQVARADTIVTDAMTATQEMTHKVQHTISMPVRQVAGLVAGIKVGVETLIERSGFGNLRGGNPRERGQGGSVPYDGNIPHSNVPGEPGRPYDV
jgi:methyl-accepting chemotaxis protein